MADDQTDKRDNSEGFGAGENQPPRDGGVPVDPVEMPEPLLPPPPPLFPPGPASIPVGEPTGASDLPPLGVPRTAGPAFLPPPPPTGPQSTFSPPDERPPVVNAIGIIHICAGVWATAVAVTTVVFFTCWCFWILGMIAGISAITEGISIVSNRRAIPSRTPAILLILTILGCDVASMIGGIVLLVMLNEKQVAEWSLVQKLRQAQG